jgi:transcription-repair coupling factor (superfamily II helicase)
VRLGFLVDAIRETDAWSEVAAFLEADEPAIRLDNLHGSSKTLVLAGVADDAARPIVVVTPDNRTAERMTVDLQPFLPAERIAFFPPSSGSAIHRELPLMETMGRRMEALRGLAEGRIGVTVMPAPCLLDEMMGAPRLLGMVLKIRHGEPCDRERLIERLVALGYRREPGVDEVGVFAVRGGVLDVYGYGMDGPARIEFMGDELVSMRTFDIRTQRSKEEIDFLHVLPMRERDDGESAPLFTYLPADGLVVFVEAVSVRSALEEASGAGRDDGGAGPEAGRLRRCLGALSALRRIYLEGLHLHAPVSDPFAAPGGDGPRGSRAGGTCGSVRFGTREPERIERDMNRLREIVRRKGGKGHRTVILCDNYGQKERIHELLGDAAGACRLEVGGLEAGFQIPEAGLTVYNDHEIFRRPRRLRYRRKYRAGGGLDSVDAIEPGDFLVHVDHGIGRYEGLRVIRIQEGEVECLSIAYRGGDRVYVPVEKLDLVEKYTSGEGAQPRLDQLGGTAWARVRRSARKGVREMAEKLLELYARRRIAGGHAFPDDTAWQLEMESTFSYEDTPDQRRTAEEVKEDMIRPRAMDRLICGDVGFGKTEIAVRAAFRAVQDNKQVAVLVPTTILAQQHFMTFSERLADYPVTVEVLSRFRSPARQKKVVRGLAEGTVDIVIGTHRLLSKDVAFRDLGLLIIDEEHRFGVADKERLKNLREGVDVLQLTATPLPRTLHLSLTGIRDISLINTPPQDRLPIVTYVSEFDREQIREAILKEVDRGGQVFFVHNRVQSIRSVASMLRSWLPEVRFAVAHGRMSEKELEDVMLDFMEGAVDVLVSTMIIGSGLDVPNANTLIVNRADRLGLAQLYQLRGRVGRSYRRAYAYLLTPPGGVVSEEARARLAVLEEHTELGSGYRIALRDMEIRGVGNILGREQHGHIHAVGLDMYNRLLEEEVKRLRGEEIDRKKVDLVIEMTSLLPADYVGDPAQRVSFYRRLSRVRDPSGLAAIEEELTDRFGAPPEAARNLLDMVAVKVMAPALGIRAVHLRTAELRLVFEPGRPENLAAWDRVLREGALRASVEPGESIVIAIAPDGGGRWLGAVRKSLRALAG